MQFFSIIIFPLLIGYLFSQERYFSRPLWEVASALFAALPVALIIQIGRVLMFPINWANSFQMIVTIWVFDFLVPSGLACLIYLKLLDKKLLAERRPGFIWFASFFFVPVMVHAVYSKDYDGLYEFFYYPLICVCFAYLFSLWLSMRCRHFFLNAFWAAILVMWSTILPGMVAWAHYVQRPTFAFIVFIIFVTFVANVIFFATKQLKNYREDAL